MSNERRTPFALIHPNARPTDSVLHPNSAPPQLPISRPRRQMPAYHQPHQQYNPHKRYATVLPGSSRSSATSSAESIHSTRSLMAPRRRKLSAAEDVAARVRARWAALEALERTSGGPAPIANPADPTTATHTNSATTAATTTTTVRNGARIRRYSRDQEHGLSMDMGKGREKENDESISMQVDGYEKPLPPRPAPLMFALHKFPEQGPLSAPARMPAANSAMMAMAMATSSPMMVDSREESGSTPHNNDDAGAGAREGERLPTSDSTLRTTPTSLTCFETTESQVLQRRPTRAVTPPQVRRRPSITDELEEAVRLSSSLSTPKIFGFPIPVRINVDICMYTEGRGDASYAPYLAHGRTNTLPTTRLRFAPGRRTRAHFPPAHPRSWGRSICVPAVRWSI